MTTKEEFLKVAYGGTTVHQISDFEYEREWERERTLQHAVLRYLTKDRLTRWNDLFLHFVQDAPGKIAPAIAIVDSFVNITPLGMEHLKGGKCVRYKMVSL